MALDTYGRLELMGHVCLYGHLTEEEIAGVRMIAIDVLDGTDTVERRYYGTTAIYCITPMTEEAVLDAVRRNPRRIASYSAVASYEYADGEDEG